MKLQQFNPDCKLRLGGQIGRSHSGCCGLVARAVRHFKRPVRRTLDGGCGAAGKRTRIPFDVRLRIKQVTHGGNHGSRVSQKLAPWHAVMVRGPAFYDWQQQPHTQTDRRQHCGESKVEQPLWTASFGSLEIQLSIHDLV
jgi:hypothetical protein